MAGAVAHLGEGHSNLLSWATFCDRDCGGLVLSSVTRLDLCRCWCYFGSGWGDWYGCSDLLGSRSCLCSSLLGVGMVVVLDPECLVRDVDSLASRALLLLGVANVEKGVQVAKDESSFIEDHFVFRVKSKVHEVVLHRYACFGNDAPCKSVECLVVHSFPLSSILGSSADATVEA